MHITAESTAVMARVVAYSVRDDGQLLGRSRSGSLVSLRGDEATLEIEGTEALTCFTLLLGAARPDGRMMYWGAVVARDQSRGSHRRVLAVQGGIAEQLLSEEGRSPLLDPRQYRYRLAFPEVSYQSWVTAGVLKPHVLDRVLVCPKCRAIPTFRFGCRRCGSGRLKREIMVHHFACAHIGTLAEFDRDATLRCPKCQTKHLAAGTDFDYAPGEHVCEDCHWKDRDAEQTGHCLNCEVRFPIHKALEQELLGYDADRLDPLAFLPELA